MRCKCMLLSLFFMLSISLSALAANGLLFFVAPNHKATNFPATGDSSVWVTDGTKDGTIELFKENHTSLAVNINGTIILEVYDSKLRYYTYYQSDGTLKGTTRLFDDMKIRALRSEFYDTENTLTFFEFKDKCSQWLYNGKTIEPVRDFFCDIPGLKQKQIYAIKKAKDLTYFSYDLKNTKLIELWKTDKTSTGTLKLSDKIYNPGWERATIDNRLFMWAEHPKRPGFMRLYTSDGTPNGTRKVRDRHPKFYFSKPTYSGNPFTFKNKYIFTAETYKKTASHIPDIFLGEELWCSNGTRKGTFLFGDIYWGERDSHASDFTQVGDQFFFIAENYKNGRELWKSNGTRKGTKMVKDIFPGRKSGVGYSGYSRALTPVGNMCYFFANDGVNGLALWKSDGTQMGTVMVKDLSTRDHISQNPLNDPLTTAMESEAPIVPIVTENDLNEFIETDANEDEDEEIYPTFSAANETDYYEIMRKENFDLKTSHFNIEGSLKGTTRKEAPEMRWIMADDKGNIFFFNDDGIHGFELWRSDGTDVGTYLVKDINPGKKGLLPLDAALLDGIYYFTFYHKKMGNVLWKSDGTEKGTIQLKKMSNKDFPSTETAWWDPTFIPVKRK